MELDRIGFLAGILLIFLIISTLGILKIFFLEDAWGQKSSAILLLKAQLTFLTGC
jgi:hypothetical protein